MCVSPFRKKVEVKDAFGRKEIKFFDFPCGKCSQCRKVYQSEWTTRLMFEADLHKYTNFVTLTYDNENIPLIDDCIFTLSKRDVQLFFKRLRKRFSLRYYLLAEYGTHTYRPHYHFIMFTNVNIDVDDLQSVWQQGIVHVGSLTVGRIAYCAKFHLVADIYPPGAQKPFVLMSRKPGIGSAYGLKSDFQKWVQDDISRGFTYVNGQKRFLPKYTKKQVLTIDQRIANYELFKKNKDNEKFKNFHAIEKKNMESIRRRSKANQL